MYALGIDLGTAFTAAATWRDGRGEVCQLGDRAETIPSVLFLREDDTFLVGEAAERRAITEAHRVAREFKRRFGDTTPVLLAGAPHSADALTGRLLRAVVDEVARSAGGPASAICLSHPANWGPYKTDLLQQAVRLADVDPPVTFTTEPEAAAAYYATKARIEPGATVAVYDLGGGTFDAAVLCKTGTGFEILGQPEGIERLGGIDVDAAIFQHVQRVLEGKLAALDEDDPAAVRAVARLRKECVRAKEALSSDTDIAIPVVLPNTTTEVRLTRAELEQMIRPALRGSVEALLRAIRSAGVPAERLHSVLLVGGASRMPIVAQLVAAELGRPVAVDAHPKHAVALGAARIAAGAGDAAADAAAPPVRRVPVAPPTVPAAAPPPAPPITTALPPPGSATAAAAVAGASGPAASGTGPAGGGVGPAADGTGPAASGTRPAGGATVPAGPADTRVVWRGAAAVPSLPGPGGPGGPPAEPPGPSEPPGRRWPLIAAAALVLVLIVTCGTGLALWRLDATPQAQPSASPSASPTPTPSPTPSPSPSIPVNPPPTPQQPPPPPPPPGPEIVVFEVVTPPDCPGQPEIVITWSATGVDEVGLSVDNPDTVGAFGTYPAAGTETLPFACGGDAGTTVTHTYTIHAGTPPQQDSRTITVSVDLPEDG